MKIAISDVERSHIKRLLTLPEDRLLVLLGYSIPEDAGVLYAPEEAKRRASEWVPEQLEKHRDAICSKYREWKNDPQFKNDIVWVHAIGGLLTSLVLGVDVYALAVLILHRGLEEICRGTEAP